MAKIPDDHRLEVGYERELIESDDYEQWTVQEILDHCEAAGLNPAETRVWMERFEGDDIFIRPIELISSSEGQVFLG